MAKRKELPLTPNMQAMLEKLKAYSEKNPFLPCTASDRRTCDALDSRRLLNGKLVKASEKRTATGRSAEFKRAVWLKDQE